MTLVAAAADAPAGAAAGTGTAAAAAAAARPTRPRLATGKCSCQRTRLHLQLYRRAATMSHHSADQSPKRKQPSLLNGGGRAHKPERREAYSVRSCSSQPAAQPRVGPTVGVGGLHRPRDNPQGRRVRVAAASAASATHAQTRAKRCLVPQPQVHRDSDRDRIQRDKKCSDIVRASTTQTLPLTFRPR